MQVTHDYITHIHRKRSILHNESENQYSINSYNEHIVRNLCCTKRSAYTGCL